MIKRGSAVKAHTCFLVVSVLFFVLFLSASDGYSQTCPNPVLLDFDDSTYTSIQAAYDTASAPVDPDQGLGLTDFTLRLAIDGLLAETVIFDQEVSVVLEGGWDCSFQNRDNNLATTIAGSLTISGGTVITSNITLTAGPLCQPGDPNNFPGNPEICDGLDNNCNGIIDDGLTFDADGDGATAIGSCEGSADDCDDTDPNNFPGNAEVCDGLDNNCDGQADEGLTAVDADNDGYSAVGSCGGSADDCNDNNPAINPGATEIYGDGIDQDCDGIDLVSGTVDTDCKGCHAVYFVNNIAHHNTPVPNGTCVACHPEALQPTLGNLLPLHYGRTVRTAGNNMTAGEIISCTSCHDWHDEEESNYAIDGDYIVWYKVHNSVVFSCDTCHENRAAAHATENHDYRIILPLCAKCHTSDTAVIGQPGTGELTTQANVDTLHRSSCTRCHDYANVADPSPDYPLDPVIVEQMILSGLGNTPVDCLSCHYNFDSIHVFIENHNSLINVGQTSCGNCHNSAPPLIDADDPKVHSLCSNCHDANYNTISLAAGKTFDPGGDCTTCHEDPFDTVHPANIDHSGLVTVGTTGCGVCHSDTPLVDSGPDDPKVHDSCSTCHDAQGGLIGLAAGKSFAAGGDCTTCHTASFDAIHPATTDHSGIVTTTGTQCSTCHSDPPPLVDSGPDDPKVHDSCSTCHDTQGRLISYAEGASAPGNCNTCHGADFTTIHPDDIDHAAIVTVGTTACAGCHSDQPPLVDPGDPKVHNTCTSCHDTDGVLQGRAAGKSFAVGGDCATCHDETFTAIHAGGSNLIQSHSDIITTTGTECGTCHSNPPPLVQLNDPKVHDSCSTCHDDSGGLIGLATGASVPGNCATCHDTDFTTNHQNADVDHTALVNVGTTSCSNCHSDPPPLVDVDPINANDPKLHDACSSCHDTNGVLQGRAAGKSFDPGGDCATCHTEAFDTIHPADVDHSQAIQLSTDCASCHDAPPPLVDLADPKVHNACASCHDAEGGLKGSASGNTAPNECITCHGNDLGTLHQNLNIDHNASPGSDNVLLFEAGSHDSAMIGDGTVYVACSTCHSTNLGNVHDNNCATCHSGSPSPYDDLGGFWLGGCLDTGQQGSGCHTVYHEEVTDGHNSVVDYAGETNCTLCHNPSTWLVPDTSCANCHATNYGPTDTTPPVTTSDVQPFYIVPISIKFSMTDNGGKVGVGTIYSKVDGGETQIGSSIYVGTVGGHTLEFWSVDQAGNEEWPHNTTTFVIDGDYDPPVTTSNAKANYYTQANITLTATDNSYLGPRTTYYILNTGPTETGNFVSVPELNGTFNYTLQFWSDDWSGNVEPIKTVNFTIHGGTGTLRLIWGNSDTNGSPCPGDPEAEAIWTVRSGTYNGPVVTSGTNGCGADPNWSGVEDIVVDVSPTSYHVLIDWFDSDQGLLEQTEFTAVNVTEHGQIHDLYY